MDERGGSDDSNGLVRGQTITLDEPVPNLEGRVTRVSDQASVWRHWAERGPQGPIDDGGAPECS